MISDVKMSVKEIANGIAVILGMLLLYAVLFAIELIAAIFLSGHLGVVMVIAMLLNLVLIFKVMNYGFRKFTGDRPLDNIFSLVFGIACYLCLIFQFAVFFYFYYISVGGAGVIPQEVIQRFQSEQTVINETALADLVNPLFGYVFPVFYRFPSNVGIVPVIQFYIGKFVDLFILAYMVERIRQISGLKAK